MSEIIIKGRRRLEGTIAVQGAKNSVLPVLAATLLHPGRTVLKGCPRLSDVDAGIAILRHLGCRTAWEGDDLSVDASDLTRWDIPERLMHEMRSSVIFLGAILARLGKAELSYPGGCELGPRPIDLHLSALRSLGAAIREEGGVLRCEVQCMRGCEIVLGISSVGATENALLAACGAAGETVIINAAREPEIVELQDYLCALGCAVRGAGSSVICVDGRRETKDATYSIMPDRIVAATYLAAAAAAGGEVELTRVNCRHLSTVTAALHEAGCRIWCEEDTVVLQSTGELKGISTVRTAPYPGFPTDAQAILMAALLRSAGTTVFVENIFENRYRHVDELRRMGAQISVAGRTAVVTGTERIFGARLRCTDLRGGAALMVAALAAEGESTIGEIRHVRRGYEDPVRDLGALGAEIRLINTTE